MKSIKAYIAGLLTGLALLCVPIYADSIWDTITVITDGIEVKVDGQAVNAPNFLYNDTTYVPLRMVAQMLGQNVTWVEEENTAYIGQVPEGVLNNTIIARVNSVAITADELIALAYNSADSSSYLSATPVSDEVKHNILEELVRTEAVNQYADAQGFVVSSTEEEALMADLNMQKEYEDIMLENHMTYDTYKKLSIKYFKYNAYLNSIMNTLANEEQVKEYYDSNQELYKEDSYTSKHILIKTVDENGNALAEDKIKEAEKKANDIYNRIQKGEDFDKLMKEFSQDGGLMIYPDGYTFERNDSVYPEYKQTAYSLKPGEVSKPVKSESGYHIIKLISFNEGVKPFEDVKEAIKQTIAYEKIGLLEKDIVGQSDIVILDDKLKEIVID